jgi:hypothetical protein
MIDLVHGHIAGQGDQRGFKACPWKGDKIGGLGFTVLWQELQVAQPLETIDQRRADRRRSGTHVGLPLQPEVDEMRIVDAAGQRLPQKAGRGRPKPIRRDRIVEGRAAVFA